MTPKITAKQKAKELHDKFWLDEINREQAKKKALDYLDRCAWPDDLEATIWVGEVRDEIQKL